MTTLKINAIDKYAKLNHCLLVGLAARGLVVGSDGHAIKIICDTNYRLKFTKLKVNLERYDEYDYFEATPGWARLKSFYYRQVAKNIDLIYKLVVVEFE